jgi:NADPH:quinone reductase-like Zn-dependent oxidoreductase
MRFLCFQKSSKTENMESKKMHAIVAKGYGSEEVFEYREVDMPRPAEHELLVHVKVSTVTRADTMMRTGKPYFGRFITGFRKPKHPIPGTGFSGVVVQSGSRVSQFKPGDQVFGETTTGLSTNAEYLVIPEDGVVLHKPESLSFEDAAALCDGPLTSHFFLKQVAKLGPGQKVLINGASGSLGTAAVQLAQGMGAEVTAVCGSKNVALCKSLGAHHVIDYTREDFTTGNQRYDVVFDTVGMSSFGKSRGVLSQFGTYVSPVLSMRLLLQMLLTSGSARKRARFAAAGMKKDPELKALLKEVLDIHKEGGLKMVIDRQFPLEKVAHAHAYIDKGHKKGNVIIIVQS